MITEKEIDIILNYWYINYTYKDIISHWNLPHRHYHNKKHLDDLLASICSDRDKYGVMSYHKLVLTALFHDIIYIPGNKNNELKSAKFFLSKCKDPTNKDVLHINEMILDTKTHKTDDSLSKVFCNYDMSIVTRSFDDLLRWEYEVRSEFSKYSNFFYKRGRIKFLKSLLNIYNNNENINKLINWVKINY